MLSTATAWGGIGPAAYTIGGEARAETPPPFVHPPAALRLPRFGAVRWGGRGGVVHGEGNCGPTQNPSDLMNRIKGTLSCVQLGS
jgi:hypothetical protein